VNGSGVKIDTLALKIDGGSAIGNAATGMTVNSVTNGYDCSYVAQSALSEGSHTYTIDIQDNDGNAANTLSVTISIDVTSPSLTVTNPTEGLITNNNSLTVSGTTNDATSTPVTIAITLNGTDQGAVTVSSGSFSKSVTLASGSNTIVVTATDASGLTTTVTRHVTLDTGAPVITSVELIPNPVDAGQTFILKVTVTD
jgi:hypothetical protein